MFTVILKKMLRDILQKVSMLGMILQSIVKRWSFCSVSMLRVIFECQYAEGHFSEWHFAEGHFSGRHYTESHFA
jgi:hypothetical protein